MRLESTDHFKLRDIPLYNINPMLHKAKKNLKSKILPADPLTQLIPIIKHHWVSVSKEQLSQ